MASRLLLGLDIGSSKTRAVIAEAIPPTNGARDPIRILGLGTVPTEGMRRCVLTNLEAATEAILAATRAAEQMAGLEVETAYVGVAGVHADVSRSSGVVAVAGREIDPRDVRRVDEVGRAVAIPPDRFLLHAIPQEYVVDGRGGIQDPVGMTATRLESEVCIVTAAADACRDLRKAVEKAGYRAEELVLEPLASSLAVVEESERREGVALIEVGGGSTDVVVFRADKIRRVRTFPWGSETVTSDIAKGLGVPVEEARRLKERFGSALRSRMDPKEKVEVAGPGTGPPRRISRELLAHIIEQRLDEIFGLVYEELEEAALLDRLGAGVVLTGGGASLPGTLELVRNVFNLPVRLGEPGTSLAGLSEAVRRPGLSGGVGLALYGSARAPKGGLGGAGRLLGRVGDWLRDFF
ncbi:MAG: cell division protein FtsA [Gemmatimonadota bacterium]